MMGTSGSSATSPSISMTYRGEAAPSLGLSLSDCQRPVRQPGREAGSQAGRQEVGEGARLGGRHAAREPAGQLVSEAARQPWSRLPFRF